MIMMMMTMIMMMIMIMTTTTMMTRTTKKTPTTTTITIKIYQLLLVHSGLLLPIGRAVVRLFVRLFVARNGCRLTHARCRKAEPVQAVRYFFVVDRSFFVILLMFLLLAAGLLVCGF